MPQDKIKKDITPYISMGGLMFLVFMLGATLGTFGYYPAPLIKKARMAWTAVSDPAFRKMPFEMTNFFAVEVSWVKDKENVTVYKPGQAYGDYTLFSSGHEQSAVLMDMEGNIVHKWQVPIEQYWDTANAQNRGFNPQLAHVGWRAAKALPNGDLIFIAIAYRSPWGLAMVRVDKDSRVIWSYLKNAHHDFDIGDDGRIYLLTHDIIQTAPKGLEFLDMPAFDERINILSPDGKELYEFSLLEAIGRSKYKEVLLKGGETNMKGDLLHTNTVKVIGPSFARHAPFAREGQVALFFREKNALAIFDLKEEKIVWAKTGFGKGAHDPDFLDNGQILLFDNKGLSNGWSRVVFMDSKNFNILRSIEGHPDRPFVSAIRSRQQWLPNGNVMITESDTGRLFEVSQTDEIVWEYVNPVRRSVNGKTYVPVIMGGVRYRADDLKFLNQS